MFEFSDSQAVESELDTLRGNDVVELVDVLMQGSVLSSEIMGGKGSLVEDCREVGGGTVALMEGAEGVQYGSKATEEVTGLLLTIHAADVP